LIFDVTFNLLHKNLAYHLLLLLWVTFTSILV